MVGTSAHMYIYIYIYKIDPYDPPDKTFSEMKYVHAYIYIYIHIEDYPIMFHGV